MGQRSIVIWAAMVLVVASCGTAGTDDEVSELPTEVFEELDSPELTVEQLTAIVDGRTSPPGYNSEPPTSGPHAGDHALCGVYRVEIPDVYQVSSLQRGTVIIQYQPTIAASTRQALETTARSLGSHVIVAPRPGLAPLVALTAWTRLLELDSADVETIRTFWEQYAQTGPVTAECPLEVALAE
jgi:hypothetical protein